MISMQDVCLMTRPWLSYSALSCRRPAGSLHSVKACGLAAMHVRHVVTRIKHQDMLDYFLRANFLFTIISLP